MFQTIERYEHNGLGLPYPIVILDGAQEELDENGARVGIHVPDQEGLATAVAIARALIPVELSGAEVRFIRRVIGMTAKDLAAAAQIDAATLSRWENDKFTMGQWADKQIRLMAVVALRDRVPGLKIDNDSVVALNPRRRAPNEEWPKIEVKLVHLDASSNEEDATDAWGVVPELLAA